MFVQYPSLHLQLSQSPSSFITTSISNLCPMLFFPHLGLFNPTLRSLSYYFLSMLLFHHDSVSKLLDEFENVVKSFSKPKQNTKLLLLKPLYFPWMPSDISLFYSFFAFISSSTKITCNCLVSTWFLFLSCTKKW